MAGRTGSLQNITMSGGGAYSLATKGAEDVINAATQIVLEALDSINISRIKIFLLSQTWELQMEEPRSRWLKN